MSNERLQIIRHSTSHLMAEAVLKLFPGTKVAIGPSIDVGFYYDFELPRAINPDEDFPKIEAEMRRLIAANNPFTRREITKDEAKELFKEQPYKREIIDGIEDPIVSIYTQGLFTDLCRGPHVNSTREIPPDSFKLTSVAGAYWRGDEKRQMLTRIYAAAFENKKALEAYLKMLEEAEKRDHRKVGKQLDLYSTQEKAGPGLIYWHPKGGRIRVAIEDYWRKAHYDNGYEILYTPHLGQSWLWQTSGHLSFYKENMYSKMEIDEQEYYLKPMNCPFHIMIYNSEKHSYRDLPLRWAELGTVYRYERSGVLHGLLRVRGFTQDDAHIICTPEQIESEIREVLRFSLDIWKTFGFTDIRAYLSTRPAKAVGEPERWETAQESLVKAINAEGLAYEVDQGGGAFYGPKIDLKIKDALGREWQTTTIQFDFNLPERFDMTYVDSDGKEKRPYMVHRALLGSLERFFGILIEQYAGAFPVWLAPESAVIIPVAPGFNDYAMEVANAFKAKGLRVRADLSIDRMNAKIRKAQNEKIPYMLVVGQREADERSVSVRRRDGKQMNSMKTDEFVSYLLEKVATKAAEL